VKRRQTAPFCTWMIVLSCHRGFDSVRSFVRACVRAFVVVYFSQLKDDVPFFHALSASIKFHSKQQTTEYSNNGFSRPIVTQKLYLCENKMLSYRRETALQGALQFSPKVEDWNWETIFYGHYRSIFNHCDIISLKICQIPWKNAK